MQNKKNKYNNKQKHKQKIYKTNKPTKQKHSHKKTKTQQ